jgi:hypothetical protein
MAIVVTKNSVRSENTGVTIIRKIMVATTISPLFVALLALVASSFRTRATMQAEILAAPVPSSRYNLPGKFRQLFMTQATPIIYSSLQASRRPFPSNVTAPRG